MHSIRQTISDVSHSIPHLTSHCRMLPPGKFNSMMTEPLPVYSKSVVMVFVTVFLYCCFVTNIVTKLHHNTVNQKQLHQLSPGCGKKTAINNSTCSMWVEFVYKHVITHPTAVEAWVRRSVDSVCQYVCLIALFVRTLQTKWLKICQQKLGGNYYVVIHTSPFGRSKVVGQGHRVKKNQTLTLRSVTLGLPNCNLLITLRFSVYNTMSEASPQQVSAWLSSLYSVL